MSAQTLNVIGFAVTALGSSLGIWGALMQANAYYPFRISQFAEHFARVFKKAIAAWSVEEALKQIRISARLGEDRKEDRAKSLIGLYFVFCGFFLNMIGACFALAASLLETAAHK